MQRSLFDPGKLNSSLVALLGAVLVSACGGGGAPPANPDGNTAGAPVDEVASDSASVGADPTATADNAGAAGGAPTNDAELDAEDDAAAARGAAEPPEDTARNKLYRLLPSGLEVTLDGVVFNLTAVAKKRGAGWGVELEVKAHSDSATRYLMSPERGPLAFAAKITAADKVLLDVGDAREGSGEQIVAPGQPVTLSRVWPADGTKPLLAGQELVLQVGLWGFGRSTGNTKVVKQFALLKLVAPRGRPAKAYLLAPE